MNPLRCWTSVWRALLGLLLWAAVAAAWAHSSSNSYLLLSEREGATVLRADVHLRDIDLVFDLDADRDGQVVWSEVLAREAEVLPWLAQGLRVGTEATACGLGVIDTQASERADGIYLSTEWRVDCPPGVPESGQSLALSYTLLFDREHNLEERILSEQFMT